MPTNHVAFLGPTGTYTEHALKEAMPTAQRMECFSVADVFDAVVNGHTTAGFVGMENLLQGPVTETLDLLLKYRGRVFLESSHVMNIHHTLGVLETKNTHHLDEITCVYSHSQAIHQCSEYLRKHLSSARLSYTESTTSAIELVKTQKLVRAAVIGAKKTLLENGFVILAENISNVANNKTRFGVIRAGNVEILDNPSKKSLLIPFQPDKDYVTTIAIDPQRDRQGLLHDILNVISVSYEINMLSIHSRPNAEGGFVFFLDLEGHPEQPRVMKCLSGLRDYCHTATNNDTIISLLGAYEFTPFQPKKFNSIGIIGGKGRMGTWFARFFEKAGYPVQIYDIDNSSSLENLVSDCDVILLSVPISQIPSITEQLSKLVSANQLIVENCSIKGCTLPLLTETLPPEVEILGLHTMFGGDINTLHNEQVVVTKTKRSGELAQRFEDIFYKFGAKIIHADIEKHDIAVAHVQSMHHLAVITVAHVLAEEFDSEEHLNSFSSRNSRDVTKLIRRVLSLSDELLTDLQLKNAQAKRIRHRYLEILFQLVSSLDYEDKQTLLNSITKSRELFMPSLLENK